MGRNPALVALLADLGPLTPATPAEQAQAVTRLGSLEAAKLMVRLLPPPSATVPERGIGFLVSLTDALEYGTDIPWPRAVWHYADGGKVWERKPAPDDPERLHPWFAEFAEWMSDAYAPLRRSEATRAAEHTLELQSTMRVIPSEHVPAFVALGKRLTDAIAPPAASEADDAP